MTEVPGSNEMRGQFTHPDTNMSPSMHAAILAAVTDHSHDGIVVIDEHREAILMNDRFVQLWCIGPELRVYGSGAARREHIANLIVDPEKLKQLHELMMGHPTQEYAGEIELNTGMVLFVNSRPIYDDQGAFMAQIFVYTDRTDLRESEAQRNFFEFHDRTTGLLNRSAMFATLEHRTAYQGMQTPFALMVIDISQFARINEQYGHPFGDRVLKRCAELIVRVVGSPHLVSRHGADEFMILFDHRSEHWAEELAEQLIDALSTELVINEVPLTLTVSGGISFFPQDGATANDLLSSALIAVQQAKKDSPGQVARYSQEYGQLELERRELEHQLSQTVDGSGLELLYQPIYDLRTQTLSSCEALLRWRSQVLGSVSPEVFLPYAEESGLIVPIGEWVLRNACTQAAAWSAETFGAVPISVNVSAKQIVAPGFEHTIAHILAETGCSPFLLMLELTETTLVSNLVQVSRTIDAIRRMGVKISIDDFGTGYSSLSYLKHFNVDTLKIDQSFTQSIGETSQDDALMQAMLSMAHDLGLIALAEGVETEEQLTFLQHSGCDQVQGFYLNRPMNAAQLTDLLSRNDPWQFPGGK